MSVSRRQFLAAASTAAALTPYHFTANAEDRAKPKSKNDRYRIGSIGMKYQGSVIAKLALPYADVVAIADVDRKIGEKAVARFRRQGGPVRRLPQDSRPQGHRRGHHRHARPLAR